MHLRFHVLAAAALVLAVAFSGPPASAQGYTVSTPLMHDNLAVYLVRGQGGGGAAPLTLEQAQANGTIRINETRTHPVMLKNLSDQSVFIQLGDLIQGGLQDQVAGTSLLLPPHSGLTALATFCVDPFRSSARDGDDPKLFAAIGAMFPSQLARLSVLSGASPSGASARLRESAVWWSLDSLRAGLTVRLGEPLETPRPAHWDFNPDTRSSVLLAARRSPWTTSLPLALESAALAQAQRAFLDALARAGDEGTTIGAVFAVNGAVVGADLYGSHALFQSMWPKLLRSFATEALAAADPAVVSAMPSQQDVTAFLVAAEAGQVREGTGNAELALRDSQAAIVEETAGTGGAMIHRGYVPKLDPAALSQAPEALLVRMLESGEVEGRPLASLGERETVIVHADPEAGGWLASIETPTTGIGRTLDLAQRRELERFRGSADSSPLATLAGVLMFMFLLFVALRELVIPAVRTSIKGVAHLARLSAHAARELIALAGVMTLTAARLAVQGGKVALATVASLLAQPQEHHTRRAYAAVRSVPASRGTPL